MKLLRVLLMGLLVMGCATSGNPNAKDQNLVSQVRIGFSTKDDVRRLFGEPNFSSQSDMMEIWSYAHANLETSAVTFVPIVGLFAGSSKMETSSVAFTFNQDGVVQNISRSQSNIVGGPGARQSLFTLNWAV
jgi:outer membrane protein assembly factor BamE (lipoprotein component of BamABCDE complex)